MNWLLTCPLVLTMLLAHSWYPENCCSRENDCTPVPCESLTGPGDRGQWYYQAPNGLTYEFPQGRVLKSQDEQCHACIHFGKPYCLFLQIPATG